MNVIRCTKCNLHYDADKYSACPHCEGEIDSKNEKVSDVEITKKSKRGIFGKKEKTNNDDFGSETIGIYSSGIYSSGNSSDNREKSYDDSNEAADFVKDDDGSNKIVVDPDEQDETETEDEFEEPASSSGNSLTQEIENITKNNTGRTMGYFSLGDSEESTKSVSNESTKQTSNVAEKTVVNIQSAPVVGWLVCTKGKHLGESFQLYDGNNSIGRGNSNDVVLFKEQGVSSNKHAIITYEPKKRYFLIQSGDSHGLTYLNDDLVTTPQKIEIYDSIEFGESAFVFVPLCGEKFSWEKYIGR